MTVELTAQVLPTIEALTSGDRARILALNASQIRTLKEGLTAIRPHLTPDQERDLSRLRVTMNTRIALIEALQDVDMPAADRKELVVALQELQNELRPSITNVTDSLRYGREVTEKFAEDNPGVVRAGLIAGGVVIGGAILTSLWGAVRHPVQTANGAVEAARSAWSTFWRGLLLSGVAAGAVGTVAYFAGPTIQEWYQGYIKSSEERQRMQKREAQVAEEMKKTAAAIELTYQNEGSATHQTSAQNALQQINVETALYADLSAFPEARQKALKQRMEALEGFRKEMQGIVGTPAPAPNPVPQQTQKQDAAPRTPNPQPGQKTEKQNQEQQQKTTPPPEPQAKNDAQNQAPEKIAQARKQKIEASNGPGQLFRSVREAMQQIGDGPVFNQLQRPPFSSRFRIGLIRFELDGNQVFVRRSPSAPRERLVFEGALGTGSWQEVGDFSQLVRRGNVLQAGEREINITTALNTLDTAIRAFITQNVSTYQTSFFAGAVSVRVSAVPA